MPPTSPAEWNQRYLDKNLPWDSGLPSQELVRVIDEGLLTPCRAIELGCGTGTNAIYLAEHGFDVTAIDLAPQAIEMAQARAAGLTRKPVFLVADIMRLPELAAPFEFLFDRGCYHCLRLTDLAAYRAALQQLVAPAAWFLLLTGNANEQTEQGPPRVTEQEIRDELGDLFAIHSIREFRFQDRGGVPGPLGWSCWMTRRAG
jgi:SAM-dependent methyltransferase